MLLKISPTTFCINTNQISPINLLHLISLSTSPALASHRQLKLPYWQMHTNNFFLPPFSILYCSKPTCDDSSGRAASVLLELKVVKGLKWEGRALLLPKFCRAPSMRQPSSPGPKFRGLCGHFCLPCTALAHICAVARWLLDVLPLAAFNAVFKWLFQSCLMPLQSSSPDKAHSGWELGWKEGKFAAERSCRVFFLLLQWEWRACRRPAGRRGKFYRCELGQAENPAHHWMMLAVLFVCFLIAKLFFFF